MDKLTSGKIAPQTGEYNIVTTKGKVVGTVRVKKGDRMTPQQKQSMQLFYFIV